jgi:hypothetical protein
MRAHVVSGFAAGQILHQACEEYGLVGEVFAIDEHPHVGPLKSDRIRHEWWRPIRDQYLDRLSSVMPGLEEQWHFALTRILDSAREVVIWSSDTANDQTHMRLAAAKLESFTGSVRLVDVPMRDGLAGVVAHYADTLAALGMRSRALPAGKRAALARDYRERFDNSQGVWLQSDRGLELADYAVFDDAVLAACPDGFTDPALITGLAMSRFDGRNLVPDMFLRWRLRLLADAGVVQAKGNSWLVDACDIRVRRLVGVRRNPTIPGRRLEKLQSGA